MADFAWLLLTCLISNRSSSSVMNQNVNSALLESTSLRVHVTMNRQPFYYIHSLLPSSFLCLRSTWLHVFMGLYLSPLWIINLVAQGVNSFKHSEEHSVWFERGAATRHTPPLKGAPGRHTLKSLYPPPPWNRVSTDFCSSYPSDVWLTHSCSEFLGARWLQTKILE